MTANRPSTLMLTSFVLAAASLATACGDKAAAQPQQPQQPYAAQQPGAYPQQPGAYPQQQQPGAYPQQQQPGAYPQQPPAGYPQQQPGAYPQPGQPAAQPGQPAPGQPAPGGGFQIPGMPAPAAGGGGAAGGTAQAMDPNFAGAAGALLATYANTEAPGMAKEGGTIAGNFQEGQTLEGQFSFQPGKCYTLVAAGAGITELDLEMQYVTPVPGLAPTIAKDSTKGAQASIGGKSNCLRPVSPFPANAKFIVKATKGAGLAAAQLYVK